MKEIEPIVFIKDGITYTYTFSISEYDGNRLVNWKDCDWEPEDLKEEKE